MNSQTRSNYDLNKERIYLEDIQTIENYRGYKKILLVRAQANAYMGYLDDHFFGFVVKTDNTKYWLMDAKSAVDYYLDKTFFHDPVLEYDTFYNKKLFRPTINLLKMVKDRNGNKNKY